MIESGYYPPGAEFDPRAPWNESGPPDERTFDVCISQSLSRSTQVTTSDYSIEVAEDEDGRFNNIDTSETDWRAAYKEERMTPLGLIEEFKSFLEKTLPDPVVFPKEYKKAKYLIEECEGWVEDDLEVVEG